MPSNHRYCCICQNHCRKIVDGRKVSLHRFPSNTQLRRVWLQRCCNVRPNFKFSSSDNTRLCSLHFVDGCGPTKDNPLPVNFSTHTYKLSNITAAVPDCNVTREPAFDDVYENGVNDIHNYGDTQIDEVGDPIRLSSESSSVLDLSLALHDYCGGDIVAHAHRCVNQICQTDTKLTFDQGTQTNSICFPSNCDVGVQVDVVNQNSIGIQVDKPCLTFEDVETSDGSIMFYTGIPDSNTFKALFDEFFEDDQIQCSKSSGGRPNSLRIIDEFFMILMRLRLGLSLEDLAYRFRISKSTCRRIFTKWIDYLYCQLSFLIEWPTRNIIDLTMPATFRAEFPTTRIIVDCTEVWTETPASLQLQSLLFSQYKSHMTYKGLVRISPAGVVTFVSDLYTGSISDKQITIRSKLLDKCEKGDAIMADKGFVISDLTTPRGIDLLIPPFKKKKKQLSAHDVHVTKAIAKLRIHVEREMERIKNFKILQGTMPITMASNVNKIWKICVCLTNLQPPLITK